MLKRFHSTLFYAGDLNKTLEFYKQLGFDAELADRTVRAKLGDFRLAFIDERTILFQDEAEGKLKGLGVFTYIEVDDVDIYYKSLQEKGVKTQGEPRDWPWGKREFVVKDPDGYKVIFFNYLKT